MKKTSLRFGSAFILLLTVLLFSGYDADAQRRHRHHHRRVFHARPHVRVYVPAPPLVLRITPPLAYRHRVAPRHRHYRYRDNYHRHYRHDRRYDRRYEDRNREYRDRDRDDHDRDFDRQERRNNY